MMHTPFGVSKVAADLYTQEYAHLYGLKTGVFRMGCITGGAAKAAEMHKKFSISKGESEAIILAQRYKKSTLILDDIEAREIAKAKGIALSDTLIGPLEALASGKTSYEEFKKNFEKIIGFMKPKADKIFKILEEAEKWKGQN